MPQYHGFPEQGPRPLTPAPRPGEQTHPRNGVRKEICEQKTHQSILKKPSEPKRAHFADDDRYTTLARSRTVEQRALVPYKAAGEKQPAKHELVIRNRHTIIAPRSPSPEHHHSINSKKASAIFSEQAKEMSSKKTSSTAKNIENAAKKVDDHGGITALLLIGAAGVAGMKLMNTARTQYYQDSLPERKVSAIRPGQPGSQHLFNSTERDSSGRGRNERSPPLGHVRNDSHQLEDGRVTRLHQGSRSESSDEGSTTDSEYDSEYDSDTLTISSMSSSIDERRMKRLKGKQHRMTAFAAVATANAVNRMYQGVKKRRERREALAKGEITPKEAQNKKLMNTVQNGAAIAAAGASIRSALLKSREAKSLRAEHIEYRQKKAEYALTKAVHDATREMRARGYRSGQRS